MSTQSVSWQEALSLVERLSWADQLRLISELLLRMQTTMPKTEPVDLLTLAGVGAEVWSEVDAKTYINEERESWQT